MRRPVVMTGFTLVDASSNTDLGAIADGAALTLADPAGGSYGVRVEAAQDADIGSMVLALSGAKTVNRTENHLPYSLYGDTDNIVDGESLPAGSYTLTATAHAEAGGQGAVLQTLTVSFTVAAEAVEAPALDPLTATFQEVPAEHENTTFSFQVLFSEAIPTGYKVLRDEDAFAVTNGKVVKAKRVPDAEGNGRDDLREIHIEPDGRGGGDGGAAADHGLPRSPARSAWTTGACCRTPTRAIGGGPAGDSPWRTPEVDGGSGGRGAGRSR